MPISFKQISAKLARQLKLIMTDVDGTITDSRETRPEVSQVIRHLEKKGITVGLVSGRTLPQLDRMARELGITGPIIAENGGVARVTVNGELVDLGFFRQPALDALEKLHSLFPEAITEREDNIDRIIDLVIYLNGVTVAELREHLETIQIPGQEPIQLLDSGYMLHLMQEGISKGNTLVKLLEKETYQELSRDDVIIFGDSLTDMSLFELFPNCVFIPNPKLDIQHRQALEKIARFKSDLPVEKGFIEAASHIIKIREAD